MRFGYPIATFLGTSVAKGHTMRMARIAFVGLALLCACSIFAYADQINFTGGTVTLWDGTTQTTNNSVTWQGVSTYEEAGYRITFIGDRTAPFESIIGNYEGGGNDVIHGHWKTGSYGALTRIVAERIDGAAFDLNYFVLTSNTDLGGGPASGNEKAYIHASSNTLSGGLTDEYSMLLPPDDWGWPGQQVFLGSQFDAVKAFWFDVTDKVDCFGMDSFYINEAAPPQIPEPTSIMLLATTLLGVTGLLRRRRA